jgi:hypothetical protein
MNLWIAQTKSKKNRFSKRKMPKSGKTSGFLTLFLILKWVCLLAETKKKL